jgi:RimJ/RimL family protein N-acetyltransferase
LDAPPVITLAGLGWLHNIKTRNGCRYADVGEVFWREYQAMGITLDMGKALLDFAFNECSMDAIYGITPEKNVPAVRFMKASGFTSFGPIPGLCCWRGVECAGYLSVLTEESWGNK